MAGRTIGVYRFLRDNGNTPCGIQSPEAVRCWWWLTGRLDGALYHETVRLLCWTAGALERPAELLEPIDARRRRSLRFRLIPYHAVGSGGRTAAGGAQRLDGGGRGSGMPGVPVALVPHRAGDGI